MIYIGEVPGLNNGQDSLYQFEILCSSGWFTGQLKALYQLQRLERLRKIMKDFSQDSLLHAFPNYLQANA